MKTKIITGENYAEDMKKVLAEIGAVRKSGTFERKTGEYVYYELYKAEKAKGWITISHGFTESTLKYAEVIYYLLREGYSVAIIDHRGHGKSFRQVKNIHLVNVDHFKDYCYDVCFFILNVVMPASDGLPLYLFGHSMGGAVAAHVAERFPGLPLKKVILCSPMICPEMNGVPPFMALMMAVFNCLKGKGRRGMADEINFDPAGDFGQPSCCSTSKYRYDWYLNEQIKNPMYQTCAPSYNWLREALLQTYYVLGHTGRIRIPVLLFQGGLDHMVSNAYEDKFIAKVKNGKKLLFPEANHEIFRCQDEEVELFINSIVSFIEGK